MTTTGEALVTALEQRGVDVVFGIPGVHTVELYRGLAASAIRHVTPRHEQGAGFMADGYARASGKPGVAFVITGPGLTNTLTPMAQARADSVPIFVVSGVNHSSSLGKNLGNLHEVPDQHALAAQVALVSEHVAKPDDLGLAMNRAFAPFARGRPGPTHVQIPLDVAKHPISALDAPQVEPMPLADPDLIQQAATRLNAAERVVILAGGGAKCAGEVVQALAECLDAPVVQTANARGIIFDHPLSVPASPSLPSIRSCISDADVVLAVGTELGQTDYDVYATGQSADMSSLIRVDICPDQLSRHDAQLKIVGETKQTLAALLPLVQNKDRDGSARAEQARTAAWEEIGTDYRQQVEILNAMRTAVPGSLLVGDSTQPVYAANLYYDHDRAGGWFNAATGYGALGYAIPAAIGASIAAPETPVICIAGDGGAQFTLPEIMAAVDENLPITFVIWNNHGYREIATSMQDAGVDVVGCDPTPPDFKATAQSFGIPYFTSDLSPSAVSATMVQARAVNGPSLVELRAPVFKADET